MTIHYLDSRVDAAGSAASATTTTGGAGTTLWNRLKAAKEVINATITGEEKWPGMCLFYLPNIGCIGLERAYG